MNAPHPASATSRRLAGYRLLRTLGQGGAGEVYEALAPDGRTVALKTFALEDDSQGLAAATFMREARLGERLAHPDIVKVLASGCEGDYGYLALEFVPGHDLQLHTQAAHRLPLPALLATVRRIAGALAHAHQQGVVHRDIKPANVLVHWPTNTVKVADFGLARLGDVFRTRTGLISGTPVYMSPEQLAETAIGPASDLYAVGVLLFELLTSRLPYEAPSLGALLRRMASDSPPRVSMLRQDLPAELDMLVAELLAKRAQDRPPNATVVAERLEACRLAATATPADNDAHGPKSRP